MIDTIYLEKEVENHPKAIEICNRFPNAEMIVCNRYSEIFNIKAQNFRLQKQKPALILAKKYSGHVLPTPPGYGIGKPHNFYFSHMLNCIYDCRYCFLQGMYRSAHYVVFVNFEDFEQKISETILNLKQEKATFFSGYDGDSLALDQVTKFSTHFISFFKQFPGYELELRTKSVNIQPLLKIKPSPNIVVAYSLNADMITQKIEHKTPSFLKRLESLKKLQNANWQIALRIDPLIYHKNWKEHYKDMFDQIQKNLHLTNVHSITLGTFRMPLSTYKNITDIYPDEPLFFSKLHTLNKAVSYHPEIEKEMRDFCEQKILNLFNEKQYFPTGFSQ